MRNQQITKQQVFNFLFTCTKSEFSTFDTMSRYLDNLDEGLSERLITLQTSRQTLLSEYKTSLLAEEINHKRRGKEEAELKVIEESLKDKVRQHEASMRLEIHPMIPELEAKSDEIERLEETQELFAYFKRFSNGEEPRNVFSFSESNFDSTARKISVLKTVIDDLPETEEYKVVKTSIEKLLGELKERILQRFQSSYWNKQFKQIRDILPLCLSLNLIEEISEFYISKIFRKANTLMNISLSNEKVIRSEVNNMFFLLQQGFRQAFIEKQDQLGQTNEYQIFRLFGNYAQNVLKSLINYVFQTLIKDSMEFILKQPLPNELFLIHLELFIEQIGTLKKYILTLIGNNEPLIYTVDSYISILFESYQEQYLFKQLGYLEDTFETNTREIMKKIEIRVDPMKKKEFKWKNLFVDYKIDQAEKLTAEEMNQRITRIMTIFMDPNLEFIFDATNKSLLRNTNISKTSEREKNGVAILNSFMKEMGELILNLIKYTGSLIPSFGRKTVLDEQYFEIMPLLNTTVQRMELIFETFSVEKSNLNEGIRLAQEKEELMRSCELELQKILKEALSSLLIAYNAILKESSTNYKEVKNNQSPTQGCTKVIIFASKYIKKIQKNYAATPQAKILQMMGNQFLGLLMQHNSTINYNKEGLYQLLVDIGHYKQLINSLKNPELQQKYFSFKTLVDIYLLKNQEISLMNYVNEEKERNLLNVKQDLITRYIDNKRRNETLP